MDRLRKRYWRWRARRSAKTAPSAVVLYNEVGISATLTTTVTYVPVRPWQDKWREVLRRRERLQRAYSGALSPLSNDDCKDFVVDFADSCLEVRDHLYQDPASPILQNDANNAVTSATYLPIVRDLSNIDKHHTSTRATTLPAHVSHITQPNIDIQVTHHRPPIPSPVDALKLADEAVAKWETFFHTRGLTP